MNLRLKKEDNRKIFDPTDIYEIMQRILRRENRIDRNSEHLRTISLDTGNSILNIELVSMGSVNQTIVEPMEVFSLPLQKRAVSIVLVHNHPSGNLQPSDRDKDITDRLIQCGLIMHVPVRDHVIITEEGYYSFEESGLLEELGKSLKYVPPYKIQEMMRKKVEEEGFKKAETKKAKEIAKSMKEKGESIARIMEYTGLSKPVIQRLK